jgi:hypothetical protein
MKYLISIFIVLVFSSCGIVKCYVTSKEANTTNNINTTRICVECKTDIDSLRHAIIQLRKN